MRIIGGEFRGRRLKSVKGRTVRPTADRVRESLFNILSVRCQDAVVLDLFAGTGALGIEALSRGAASAVFVDINQISLRTLSENIRSCMLMERCGVIRWDIRKNLNCLKPYPFVFNLIFMDPPYQQNFLIPTLDNLLKSNSLAPNALIVIEHSAAEELAPPPDSFKVEDQRKYGKTIISFLGRETL